MKKVLFWFPAILFSCLFFFVGVSKASATDYWFDNAVNTNPATLGNYWLDDGLSIHAVSLPDLAVDQLTITGGATYNGSATIRVNGANDGTITGNANFYDSAINTGLVSGNAIFYGDSSENGGTVSGTKTRWYTVDGGPERDFVSDGAWTVELPFKEKMAVILKLGYLPPLF